MEKRLGQKENFVLGASAGIVMKTVTVPLERVKLLLQCQKEMIKAGRLSRPYKGAGDCVRYTFRTEGLLPFWRGYMASCLNFFPSQALNFTFKEKMKTAFKTDATDSHQLTFAKNIGSGSAAGVLTLCFVYSIDFARVRLANDVRVANKGGAERQFSGLVDVYRKTFKSDGIVGLHRGFTISCVGIFVYRGLYFGLYDSLKPLLPGDEKSIGTLYMLSVVTTITAGLMAYPFDTIRCRMLMRSCESVKYKGSFDCALQISKKDGPMSFMKGAGVSIARGIVGSAMLVGYDKGKSLYMKSKFSE